MEAIKESVVALAHTPQYKMHKYFARRPYNVFSNLIEYYTKPNDIVYDCFCGGGVTIFESLKLGRKAIGVDLNPLATMITETQIFTNDLKKLSDAFDYFLKVIKEKYNKYYLYKSKNGTGQIIWTEWVYTVKCPLCGSVFDLSEINKIKNGVYKCSNDTCVGNAGVERLKSKPYGIKPIRVKYVNDLNQVQVVPVFDTNEVLSLESDLKYIKEKSQYDCELPLDDMDRQREDRLKERGIISYSDLFTERNFALSCKVFDEILNLNGKYDNWIIDYIYLAFSSSLRYINNMTRVTDNWENGNPTSMDKHAFWLPNQFVETNLIDVLESRMNAIKKGCEYSKKSLSTEKRECYSYDELKKSDFMVLNQSSDSVPLPDKSVDMVITDPPYGSNVQYAELSIIWNHWFNIYKKQNKEFISEKEAVVHRRLDTEKKKTVTSYKNILTMIFSECNRVLKDNGYLIFTFNNKNMNVWLSMLKSVSDAGFRLAKNGILFQDYIESYKNTSHLKYAGNIQGDFIYTFEKKKPEELQLDNNRDFDLTDFLDEAISNIIKSNFKSDCKYSTTDIYTKILYEVSQKLMENMSNINLDFSRKVDDLIIEKILKKYAYWENGQWTII